MADKPITFVLDEKLMQHTEVLRITGERHVEPVYEERVWPENIQSRLSGFDHLKFQIPPLNGLIERFTSIVDSKVKVYRHHVQALEPQWHDEEPAPAGDLAGVSANIDALYPPFVLTKGAVPAIEPPCGGQVGGQIKPSSRIFLTPKEEFRWKYVGKTKMGEPIHVAVDPASGPDETVTFKRNLPWDTEE